MEDLTFVATPVHMPQRTPVVSWGVNCMIYAKCSFPWKKLVGSNGDLDGWSESGSLERETAAPPKERVPKVPVTRVAVFKVEGFLRRNSTRPAREDIVLLEFS